MTGCSIRVFVIIEKKFLPHNFIQVHRWWRLLCTLQMLNVEWWKCSDWFFLLLSGLLEAIGDDDDDDDDDTVDGRNPTNQLRLVVYPIIYIGLYIHSRCCRIYSINCIIYAAFLGVKRISEFWYLPWHSPSKLMAGRRSFPFNMVPLFRGQICSFSGVVNREVMWNHYRAQSRSEFHEQGCQFSAFQWKGKTQANKINWG